MAFALALNIFAVTGLEVRAAETITITFSQNGEGGTKFETWTKPTTVSAGTTLKFNANQNDSNKIIGGIEVIYCKEEYDTSNLPNIEAIGEFVGTNLNTIIASCKVYKDELDDGISVETANVSSRWIMSAFCYANDAGVGADVYVLLTPAPATESKTDSQDSAKAAPHTHSFEWTVTKDPTKYEDGLEEYKCKACGAVEASQPISMYMFRIKELYGLIKEAPKGGSVAYDFGDLATVSDYILAKLAERNDVAVTVSFMHNGEAHSITFPAGTDYTAVLNDEDAMYGFYGVAARLGLTVE